MIVGLVITALALCGGGASYFLLSSGKTTPVASVQEKNQILKRLIANQPMPWRRQWGLLLKLELLPLLLYVNNQLSHLKVCNTAAEHLYQNQRVILI